MLIRPSLRCGWGGWGCEVSCGHHRPRGKTTTGSALDGAVFDIARILAYLVHIMSRSQLYLGFGHFALAAFMKIIGHIGHFQWLGPNDWWEISQIWIDIKPIGQMSDEPWKFFGYTALADSILFSVNNILAGLWLNCISSVEITLFPLADILLQHRALFQC